MEKEYDFSNWQNIYIDELGNTAATNPKLNTDLGFSLGNDFHAKLKEAIENGKVKATLLKSLNGHPTFSGWYSKLIEDVRKSVISHQKEMKRSGLLDH